MLANWSPKLRGLFPGTVTEGASPEPGMLYVEFDDGDSGYMRLEGIRMLPADYPAVGELGMGGTRRWEGQSDFDKEMRRGETEGPLVPDLLHPLCRFYVWIICVYDDGS